MRTCLVTVEQRGTRERRQRPTPRRARQPRIQKVTSSRLRRDHVVRLPRPAPGQTVPVGLARCEGGGAQGTLPREGPVHGRVARRLPCLLAVRARRVLAGQAVAGRTRHRLPRGCVARAPCRIRGAGPWLTPVAPRPGCRCMVSMRPAAQIRCTGRASSWRATAGRAWSWAFRPSSPARW